MQELGHEATPDELAEAMEMPVDRVRVILKMAQQPISMQSPVGEADETHFGDLIEDKAAENPSDATSFNLLRGKIGEVLHGLNERERKILELRYGLTDGCPRTLEEVGNSTTSRANGYAKSKPKLFGNCVTPLAGANWKAFWIAPSRFRRMIS